MISEGKYINSIVEQANIIRQEIISKCKMGLYDDNKYMENFMRDILNICYDLNLVNLNATTNNYPGVDLGDVSQKIAYQITATKTSEKINNSLETMYKNNVFTKFSKIKFFIITEKQSSYSIKNSYQDIIFDEKKDILDFDDLYKDILFLDVKKKRLLAEYLYDQIPDILKEMLDVDYFDLDKFKRYSFSFDVDDWVECEGGSGEFYNLIVNHNFNYIPYHVTVLDEDSRELITPKSLNEKNVIIGSGVKFKGTVLIS